MVLPLCNCQLSPFQNFISNCNLGVSMQMAGTALLGFTAVAFVQYYRYWVMVGRVADSIIEKVMKRV